jgi:hypothetical protein
VVTLCLVNRERADRGLPRLVVQPELQRAAQRQSEDMGARRFFAHVNPDGLTPTDRIRAAGYPARSWTGENLYAGYDADADADADATAAAVRGCTAPATRTTSCARSSRGRHRHRRPAGRVGCARASGRVHEHLRRTGDFVSAVAAALPVVTHRAGRGLDRMTLPAHHRQARLAPANASRTLGYDSRPSGLSAAPRRR